MTNASRRASRWGRLLFIAAGLLTLTALLDDSSTRAAQQTGKGKTTPQLINDLVVTPKDNKGNEVEVGLDVIAFLNEQIEKGWKDNKLTPAERCTDYEFIRRASLDLIGRIAKVNEIAQFMSDPPQYRRSALIERLLASPEFANHFANIWTNMLLTRAIGDPYHSQMHLWLYEQFSNEKGNVGWDKIVTHLLSDSGRTSDVNPDNERPAATYILAHMGEQIPAGNGNANWKENGRFDMVPVTSRTTRLFLGLRTQCTQCHDHPLNDEWKQFHFWGVNAFFRQADVGPSGRILPGAPKKKKGEMGKQQFELKDNSGFNVEAIVPYERRNGIIQYAKPVFLFGEKMPAGAKNRRAELAKLVTKNDYFGKAFVNRMWGHFFGRSFTKEPDDFGLHSQISHPVLLERLSKEWTTKYKHDPKALIRWICNSRAYGLSSISNDTNDKTDAEPFFSRMLLKAMSPEQLFESLMIATEFKAGDKAGRQALRNEWLDRLVVNFGDDEGSEGTFNGTVVQALLMMNGKDINAAILDKSSGTLSKIFAKYGQALVTNPQARREAMKTLYLAALNRPPNDRELERNLSDVVMRFPKMPRRPRDLAFYHGFYQDMMWALLNSNEFILNH